MPLLRRIEEDNISHYNLVGENIHQVEKEIKGLIDIVLSEESRNVDLDFFDLRGTVLLYGIPGIGKTSVMNNCMFYALKQYGADCYELMVSHIIESELGKATKNLAESLSDFDSKSKGVLFIDELDRLCVNRNSEEISELRRMLIELMRFFDRQKASSEKMVLCCTNVIGQIDPALLRRFSICEKLNEKLNPPAMLGRLEEDVSGVLK